MDSREVLSQEGEASLQPCWHEPTMRIIHHTMRLLICGCTAAETSVTQRLKDVHEGLPASGVQNGSVHIVEGSYDYHHYMQVHHP